MLIPAVIPALLLLVASDTPVIDAPVVDQANVLAQSDIDTIGDTLRAHHAKTGVQMAVLIIDTTEGVPIEDYSLAVAEKWQGGTKGCVFSVTSGSRRSPR